MHLSVIVPAYNEEKNIKNTLNSIYGYLSAEKIDHEILVVTDGSKDRTVEIVRSAMAEIPTLQIIAHEHNIGKGGVVKEGMLRARGDFRLFTDADNATTIDHIERMMPFFNEGYDVVIGSIGVKGKTVAAGSEPFYRVLFGKMGNLFIQLLVVPGIMDTQRGFKIVTAKAAADIFPRLTITRWGFDIEMLALARKFGYKIKEVPVNWKNDPNSHVKLSAYFQVLIETVKIRWNLLTGVYDRQQAINS